MNIKNLIKIYQKLMNIKIFKRREMK